MLTEGGNHVSKSHPAIQGNKQHSWDEVLFPLLYNEPITSTSHVLPWECQRLRSARDKMPQGTLGHTTQVQGPGEGSVAPRPQTPRPRTLPSAQRPTPPTQCALQSPAVTLGLIGTRHQGACHQCLPDWWIKAGKRARETCTDSCSDW